MDNNNDNNETMGFLKIIFIIVLMFISIIYISKELNIGKAGSSYIYTKEDYYRDNPNATQSYDELIKEEEYKDKIKREIHERQGK